MLELNLTTVDNPYNPFTEWNDWLNYDVTHGYMTCERLASITPLSDALSDEENNQSIIDSMNELIKTGAIAKDGKIIEYIKIDKNGNKC